jgi:hypothetical protein
MDSDIRPMTVAELFDGAFVTCGRQGMTLLKITTTAALPFALLFLGYFRFITTQPGAFRLEEHIGAMLVLSALLAFALTGLSVARGAVAIAVFRMVDGETVSASGCWRDALRQFMPLAFAGLFGWAATFVGAWFCLFPAVIPTTWWSLARASIVREGLPPLTALHRSRQLLRGHGMRVWAVQSLFAFLYLLALLNAWALMGLLLLVLKGFLTVNTTSVERLIGGAGGFNYVFLLWLALAVFVALEPFKGCLDALLYLDARVRAEGVDLQQRLRSLGIGAALTLVFVCNSGWAAEHPTAAQARKELAEILRRPEFEEVAGSPELQRFWKDVKGQAAQYNPDATGWFHGVRDALRRFKNWLKERSRRFTQWLGNLFRRNASRSNRRGWFDPAQLVSYALIVILIYGVFMVVYLIARRRSGAGREGAPAGASARALEDALTRTPDAWRSTAQQWASDGNFRDAMRALYLAMLAHLHRARRIDYHRAHTNWQYVRTFRGDNQRRKVLTQLTYTFDEKWYGARPCTQRDFEEFAEGVRTMTTVNSEQ